jgi:hypothetical protein
VNFEFCKITSTKFNKKVNLPGMKGGIYKNEKLSKDNPIRKRKFLLIKCQMFYIIPGCTIKKRKQEKKLIETLHKLLTFIPIF